MNILLFATYIAVQQLVTQAPFHATLSPLLVQPLPIQVTQSPVLFTLTPQSVQQTSLLVTQSLPQAQQKVDFQDRVVFMKDVTFASIKQPKTPSRELLMDVAFPIEADELLPALVIVRGGSWSDGRKNIPDEAIRIFAQGGYFVVSIEYRLSSEAQFPAAVHDCKAAI